MEGISSVEALNSQLKRQFEEGRLLIGVDGMPGAGKTTLAKLLGNNFGIPVVSLDPFVEQHKGGFVQHLRITEVQAALEDAHGPAIVEGVCLRAAAQHCHFVIDFHVYVRRLGKNGLWYEETICLTEEPVEKLKEEDRQLRSWAARLSDERSKTGRSLNDEQAHLTEELIDYHADYTPVQRADVIFDVTKD